MIKYKCIKTLTAGVALATAFYPQAWAADTGSCGPNCVYTYDPVTYTLTYTGTGPNGSGEVGYTSKHYGLSGPVENAIISEGITRVYQGSGSTTIRDIGTQDGKLVIPSTMQSFDIGSSYLMGFGTIEINSKNIDFSSYAFLFKSNVNTNIIVSSDANITFDDNSFHNESYNSYQYPANITISCKGNPDACLSKFGNSLDNMSGTITPIYYEEYDSSGKPIEIWNKDGGFKYDANGNLVEKYNTNGKIAEKYDEKGNTTAKYDTAGNLLASYDYASDGSVYTYDANHKLVGAKKTSPFTPAEAAALVKKGNNNKVILTFK